MEDQVVKFAISGNFDPVADELEDNNAMEVITDKQSTLHKIKEKVLRMGDKLYERIRRKINMRPRTLINMKDPLEWVIQDDTVLISLSQQCKKARCGVQLLEPKL